MAGGKAAGNAYPTMVFLFALPVFGRPVRLFLLGLAAFWFAIVNHRARLVIDADEM